MNRNTGISARIRLNNQEYVQATLLHRVCIQNQEYENKDRFKFWPPYTPPHQTHPPIQFNIRRGILEGQHFVANLEHVKQIPNDIVNGTRKYTSRAERARIDKQNINTRITNFQPTST